MSRSFDIDYISVIDIDKANRHILPILDDVILSNTPVTTGFLDYLKGKDINCSIVEYFNSGRGKIYDQLTTLFYLDQLGKRFTTHFILNDLSDEQVRIANNIMPDVKVYTLNEFNLNN
jgi:hypothetical protein